MKNIFTFLLLLLAFVAASKAQSFTQVYGFGGTQSEAGTRITSDAAGNVWVLGYFSGTTEIAGESRTAAGRSDCFLAKFDSDHALLWLKTFGGMEEDYGNALVHDSLGNVYVAASSASHPRFDSVALTGFGKQDITLSKYDADGHLGWAKIYGGAGVDFVNGMLLQDGQLYLTGTFEGMAQFGSLTSISDAERAAFVLKTDTSGNTLWLKKGICYDRFWDCHILGDGQGNIYFLGQFAGTGYFGPFSFETSGYRNYVLIKLTADGQALWAKQIKKVPNLKVASAPEGGILLAGVAGYDFEIDNQVFSGGDRMWVARLDSIGHLVWLQNYAQENVPNPIQLVTASDNSFYLIGTFHDSLMLGDDRLYCAVYYQDKVFVSHFDENGTVLHSIQSGNFGSDVPFDLHFVTDSTMLMVGRFSQTVTMGDQRLKSNGNYDVFLATLSTKYIPKAPEAPAPPYVRVFPNPTDGLINIDAGGYTGAMQFELYDLGGRLLQSSPIYPDQDWAFLEVYQPGMYLYRVVMPSGKFFGGKLVRGNFGR